MPTSLYFHDDYLVFLSVCGNLLTALAIGLASRSSSFRWGSWRLLVAFPLIHAAALLVPLALSVLPGKTTSLAISQSYHALSVLAFGSLAASAFSARNRINTLIFLGFALFAGVALTLPHSKWVCLFSLVPAAMVGSGLAIYRLRRSSRRDCMPALTVLASLMMPIVEFLLIVTYHHPSFVYDAEFPWALGVTGGLALALASLLMALMAGADCLRLHRPALIQAGMYRRLRWLFPGSLATLFIAGYFFAKFEGDMVHEQQSRSLLIRARTLAAALDHELIKALATSRMSLIQFELKPIESALRRVLIENEDISYIHLWTLRDGEILSITEGPFPQTSRNEGNTRHAPDKLSSDTPYISEPYQDARGYLISAYAPVKTSDAIPKCWLGLDAQADNWLAHVNRARLFAMAFVFCAMSALVAALLIITTRRIHEAERRDYIQRDARRRAIDDYLAVISHELRTPLQNITGACNLAYNQSRQPATRYWLQTVIREGERLLGLINDLLDYSALRRHSLSLLPRPVRISGVLEEVIGGFRSTCLENGQQMVFSPLEDPIVMVDERRVRQIAVNLLGNAAKHSKGQKIEVRLAFTRREGSRHEAHLSVLDNGKGIPETELERMQLPFTSLPGENATPSTGLGLSITRELCTAMGGRLHLRNRPKGGLDVTACFLVEIKKLPPSRENRRLQGRKCLLIEDQNTVREVIAGLLKNEGAIVIAPSPASFHEAGEDWDIALVDIRLDHGSGTDILAALHRKRNGRDASLIIAMSAHADDETIQEALAAGADDFLCKPITIDSIMETMATQAAPLTPTLPDWPKEKLVSAAIEGIEWVDRAQKNLPTDLKETAICIHKALNAALVLEVALSDADREVLAREIKNPAATEAALHRLRECFSRHVDPQSP